MVILYIHSAAGSQNVIANENSGIIPVSSRFINHPISGYVKGVITNIHIFTIIQCDRPGIDGQGIDLTAPDCELGKIITDITIGSIFIFGIFDYGAGGTAVQGNGTPVTNGRYRRTR